MREQNREPLGESTLENEKSHLKENDEWKGFLIKNIRVKFDSISLTKRK